jgi:hypothetical protein
VVLCTIAKRNLLSSPPRLPSHTHRHGGIKRTNPIIVNATDCSSAAAASLRVAFSYATCNCASPGSNASRRSSVEAAFCFPYLTAAATRVLRSTSFKVPCRAGVIFQDHLSRQLLNISGQSVSQPGPQYPCGRELSRQKSTYPGYPGIPIYYTPALPPLKLFVQLFTSEEAT